VKHDPMKAAELALERAELIPAARSVSLSTMKRAPRRQPGAPAQSRWGETTAGTQ
jgi:hypothetical protein